MDTVIVIGIFFILMLQIPMGYFLWQMIKTLKKVEEGVDNLSAGVIQLTAGTYLLLCEQYHLSLSERVNLGKELNISDEVVSLALKDQELLQLPTPEENE